MKVFFLEHPRVIAKERRNDIANAPLAASLLTGYAAACAQAAGHEIYICEGWLDRLSYAAIRDAIAAFRPDALAVHLVYQWNNGGELYAFLQELVAAGLCRHIIGYGYYPTFAWREILEAAPAIDALVIGEPEESLVALLAALATGNPDEGAPALSDPAARPAGAALPGTAVRARRDGITEIIMTRRAPVRDLDTLPFPLRTTAALRGGEVNIAGSRGCYGSCTFCYINPFYAAPLTASPHSQWRARSPENIAAEISAIIDSYGLRKFYFTDPNFLGPGARGKERALRLAALLQPLGIKFGMEARVNDIDEATIMALRDAGLCELLVGLESGSQRALDRLNKHTTIEQNERALAILRRCDIATSVGFIMFEPDSTPEDLRINFDFLKRNRLLEDLCVSVNVLYHNQIVLQGASAYAQLAAAGRLEFSSHSRYEAQTCYADDRVRTFAAIMREVTGMILDRLDADWDPAARAFRDAGGWRHEMNAWLVDFFDQSLARFARMPEGATYK